jgi:hypothetical protein
MIPCACNCGTLVDPNNCWIDEATGEFFVDLDHAIDHASDVADAIYHATHDAIVSDNLFARVEG